MNKKTITALLPLVTMAVAKAQEKVIEPVFWG